MPAPTATESMSAKKDNAWDLSPYFMPIGVFYVSQSLSPWALTSLKCYYPTFPGLPEAQGGEITGWRNGRVGVWTWVCMISLPVPCEVTNLCLLTSVSHNYVDLTLCSCGRTPSPGFSQQHWGRGRRQPFYPLHNRRDGVLHPRPWT